MSWRFPNWNPQGAPGFAVNVSNSQVQLGQNNVLNVDQGAAAPRQPQPRARQSRPPREDKKKSPEKALTKSEREPTMEQMDNISKGIDKYKATAWKELGEQLGLSKGEVETVEHDFHLAGTYECCYQMLKKWKERSRTPPMLKTLAQALCDIGRGDLSDDLAY